MLGAIAGDVIGSVYEQQPTKREDFALFQAESRFTDDTVLTVAVAAAILDRIEYGTALKSIARRYPFAGYGGSFKRWLFSEESRPYNSWGNGSAMRVSPVGFAFDREDRVLQEAERSAAVTHNHPEGIKGAQATALAIFMARTGGSKAEIRAETSNRFGYDLHRTLDGIRPVYRFDISCQGTVPEAMIAFLESESFEDALRKGISLGGDSDTIGSIAGGIAQAYFGRIPEEIETAVRQRLPGEFITVIERFNLRFLG